MPVPEKKVELELIDRARQGSVEAFEQLVLQYQDSLYRFLLVRANCQLGSDLVEDPVPYQMFFSALSKAMFLEAHEVE